VQDFANMIYDWIEWLKIPSIPISIFVVVVGALILNFGNKGKGFAIGLMITAIASLVIIQVANGVITNFTDEVTF
jgi:1,4-dihydroxy-2-naphthoate octaprenyltransferase